MIKWARKKSPWLYHLNCGGCNGCDIELLAALTPVYDAERLGIVLKGSPKHADLIIVTGIVNKKNVKKLLTVIKQCPDPKKIVVIGSCGTSLGIFTGSYFAVGPLDKLISVDAFVSGCPPRPQAILYALKELLK